MSIPPASVSAVVVRLPLEGAVSITIENCTEAELPGLLDAITANTLRSIVITWAAVAAGHEPPNLDGGDDQDEPS